MLSRFVFYYLIFLSFAVVSLPGCHTSGKKSPTSIFSDEQSMRQMLKGTWILKEYEDSIDAGLTPKLLEYMLGMRSSITYDQRSAKTSTLQSTRQHILYFDNNSDDEYSVRFDPANSKMSIKMFSVNVSEAVDTAEFVVEDGDTLLRLYKDSTSHDFVKYDMGKCSGLGEYNHLVNSKFIAGKYYTLDDTAHRHHIIFTKCGDIEGVEYISPKLKDLCNYDIALAGFYTDPDQISFYNVHHPNWKSEAQNVHWDVVEDSLLIWHDRYGKTQPIVLVKAQ